MPAEGDGHLEEAILPDIAILAVSKRDSPVDPVPDLIEDLHPRHCMQPREEPR